MHAHIVFQYSALWLGKNWHYPIQDIFIVLNPRCVLDVPRTQRTWGCGTRPSVRAFTTCIHEGPERETHNRVGYISRVMPWIWITVRKTWLFTWVVDVSKPYQLPILYQWGRWIWNFLWLEWKHKQICLCRNMSHWSRH